jgi:hypothetical protein
LESEEVKKALEFIREAYDYFWYKDGVPPTEEQLSKGRLRLDKASHELGEF